MLRNIIKPSRFLWLSVLSVNPNCINKGHATQNVVKSENTDFIKQMSLFETALVMKNSIDF